MKNQNETERLTVLVSRGDIIRIKHLAIERRASASQIVRSAVASWLTAAEKTQLSQNTGVNNATK